MFIKSLELNNFKRFKHLEIEFPGDITVIKGPNEQGKSTLVQALIASLFYDPAKSNELIKNCKAWGCEKFYKIRLVFESGGEDYSLTKDFESKKISLVNQGNSEEIQDYKEIAKKLNQLGGYQTPELFFNTACVKQGELAVLDKKQTISEALQDIVSGGGTAVSLNLIFKRIESAEGELRRGLERGMAKNPGKILRLSNALEEKSRELEDKKKIFTEEDIARQERGRLRLEHEKNEKSLKLKEQVYKDNVMYFETKQVLDRLNKEHEKISKIIEVIEGLARERDLLKQNAVGLKKFGELDIRPIISLSTEIERINKEIKERDEQICKMREKKVNFREVINAQYLIASSLLIGAGLLGFFFHKLFFLSWVLLGLFSFWFAFSKSVFLRISRKKIEQDRAKIIRELHVKEGYLMKKIKETGVTSVEAIEEKKNELREILNKIEVRESKIEGALGESAPEELIRQKREIEKRIGIEEQKLGKFQRVKLPSLQEQETLEQDLEILRRTVRDLDRKIAGFEAVLQNAKAPYEEIIRLEEKIYSLQEELKRAQTRDTMLSILLESLREAQQKMFSSTRKILEQYIGEFLSEITDGKYSNISIDSAMKLKVLSQEFGAEAEIEPEGNLSTGAVEQLYLVARFALISLLYDGVDSRPLVILDDPFGNFDPKRKVRTRHILKKLSEKFQILLMTCSNEYDKWGAVFDLGVRS